MRRTILIATLATFAGFCFAGTGAFGALGAKIWRAQDESFHLGYVIGYLDAVRLTRRKDSRAYLPTETGKDHSRWVRGVNEFYADPANENRPVPDAMQSVGDQIRNDLLKEWGRRRTGKPVASPTSTLPE